MGILPIGSPLIALIPFVFIILLGCIKFSNFFDSVFKRGAFMVNIIGLFVLSAVDVLQLFLINAFSADFSKYLT